MTHAKTAKDLWLAGIEKEKENALARAASLKSSVSASSSKKRQQLENKKKILLNHAHVSMSSLALRHVHIVACELICMDLSLSTLSCSILRGENMTTTEAKNDDSSKDTLDKVVKQGKRGLALLRQQQQQAGDSVAAVTPVQLLRAALHLCMGMAQLRRGDSIVSVVHALAQISLVPMEEEETETEMVATMKNIQQSTTLCLVECHAYSNGRADEKEPNNAFDQGRDLCKNMAIKHFLVVGLCGMLDAKECQSGGNVSRTLKDTKKMIRSVKLLSKSLEMLEEQQQQQEQQQQGTTLYTSHWEALFHLELGNVMWLLGNKTGNAEEEQHYRTWKSRKDKDHSYFHWMKAARLRPNWGAVLCCLGKFFLANGKKVEKGLQFIERGLGINPFMNEEGTLYAQTLLSLVPSSPSSTIDADPNIQQALATYDRVMVESQGKAPWALEGRLLLLLLLLSLKNTGLLTLPSGLFGVYLCNFEPFFFQERVHCTWVCCREKVWTIPLWRCMLKNPSTRTKVCYV